MAENTNTPETKKPKTAAPCRSDLPALTDGVVWDTVDIGDFVFKIAVAASTKGAMTIAKNNEKALASLFNRALRIAVPQRLDARARMHDAKTPEAKAKLVEDLQNEILDFDITTIRVATPKTPEVSVPKGTPKSLIDQLIAQGVKVNFE